MKVKWLVFAMLVPVMAVIVVADMSYAQKKIAIGKNKGKPILNQGELIQLNTETLNETLTQLLEEQKKNTETIQDLMKSLQAQAKANEKLAKAFSANLEKQNSEIAKVLEMKSLPSQATGNTSDNKDLIALIKVSNGLLQKIAEEQKWLSAILQGHFEKKATIGGRR